MGKKVVTLGEIMLRLSTPGNTRFVQSDSFDVVYGGGEANVAVSCANYGHEAYFVTKLPKHEIGQSAVNALRKYGVKTDFIASGGDRVGIYYLETGASMRPSKVIYDRAGSSIAEAVKEDFDWDKIFEGADWFHFTGITPALGDNIAEICMEAVKKAKEKWPNAQLLVHPECKPEIVELADYVGSTTGIMNYARKSDHKEFIIGTENSIVTHLQMECTDKIFHPLSKDCVCHNMKLTTLVDVYNCLKGLAGEEIILPEEVSKGAKRCIDRMLELN